MKEIILAGGYKTKIDDADAGTVSIYSWHISRNKSGNRYAAANPKWKGPTILLHRLIMRAKKGMDVDHINGDGLDNQRCNLRIATRTQNLANMKPRHGKFKGVSFDKRRWSWKSYISVNNSYVHLGCFATAEGAARAYDAAAVKLHGDFARTNCAVNSPHAPESSLRDGMLP